MNLQYLALKKGKEKAGHRVSQVPQQSLSLNKSQTELGRSNFGLNREILPEDSQMRPSTMDLALLLPPG